MTSDEATIAVIRALNARSIPHMAVGSLSSNLYGVPRSTLDADFVIQLGGATIHDIVQMLGPGFRLDPQMAFESATSSSYYTIWHEETQFRFELFLLRDDPHDQERFARRRSVPLLDPGSTSYALTAEDVVITKLRWFMHLRRNKDIDDVRNVISVQRDRLDWDYIHSWCDRHGTCALLDEIRASVPTD
jgi:hypothetical protein